MKVHPSDFLLQNLFEDSARVPASVVTHLAGCPKCRRRVSVLKYLEENCLGGKRSLDSGPADYDSVLHQVERSIQERQISLEEERGAAEKLVLELIRTPAERRRFLLRSNPRYHTWSILCLLVDRAHDLKFLEPEKTEILLLLALDISQFLDSAYYGSGRIEDLRARSWAYIANSRRIRGDFGGAEQAFDVSLFHLAHGTSDDLERALILDLRASLSRSQRKLDEALSLLSRSIRIFGCIGDRHRQGRALVKVAVTHSYGGEPDKGILHLHQAVELIDPTLEPRLLLCAWHNMSHNLAVTGRLREAQRYFARARRLYARFQDPQTAQRMKWLEGTIKLRLGSHQEATTLLLETRNWFAGSGLQLDSQMLTRELAVHPGR
jgi:tetratricopeptide (TPR) repeat protein